MTRYKQSLTQSAELLRMALARMGQHEAPFNPITFAVWYEHLAGINPALSKAIEGCLDGEPRLSLATVERLYRDHVADFDEQTAERVSSEFGRVMQGLSETAARTGHSASDFGRTLGALNRTLEAAPDNATLAAQMGDALASTARMQGSVAALQQQVATSQQEIEQLRADLTRTREEALVCPLTRVLNRKGFDHRLVQLLEQAEASNTPSCLVMIDVDHFKEINDQYGHLIGDRVLEAVGEVLRRATGERGACTARYGGDEFALMLPQTPVAEALRLAETVRHQIHKMRIRQRASDKTIQTVTVSAGVAASQRGDDPATFVQRADAALYRSKQAGRDRVAA